MEIRDVIHGSISVHPLEIPILDSRYFQRLRQIKQMGFAEYSFPGATHNRYIHSLGALETATQAFDQIFLKQTRPSFQLSKDTIERFRTAVRLAALLHDIGHGPLSHTSEFAMPPVADLKIPSLPLTQVSPRKATHEDYTLKMILDSGLTPLIEKAGSTLGIQPIHIAALIEPTLEISDGFFHDGSDFRPILKQMISSELDADRMDYLRRDSLHAGVSYGQFDFRWLIGNLTAHIKGGRCYLGLEHRALYTFEDFLISRFHMFLMVYFHHKSVIFDEMLGQYLESQDCTYSLPSDIELYCQYDDTHLYSHLAQSSNKWARRIIEKRAHRVLIEIHSGIPTSKNARIEQKRLLAELMLDLDDQNVPYRSVTSTGELSKYFRTRTDPIFVRYDNQYNAPSFIPLEQCTDLFQKFSDKTSITRLYVSPEDYARYKHQGKDKPLLYQEAPLNG